MNHLFPASPKQLVLNYLAVMSLLIAGYFFYTLVPHYARWFSSVHALPGVVGHVGVDRVVLVEVGLEQPQVVFAVGVDLARDVGGFLLGEVLESLLAHRLDDVAGSVDPVHRDAPLARQQEDVAIVVPVVAPDLVPVGEIEETLKWGQPAYLTSQTRSGTTIRIDWNEKAPREYAMYFHCQTDLVATFREWFPEELRFEGNRRLVFLADEPLPRAAVAACIAAALTYNREKKRRRKA